MHLCLMQCIQCTDGHHIILSCNSSKLAPLLQKFHGKLIAHRIFRIHSGDLRIYGLICCFNDHMILQPLFFIFFYKAIHPFGSLPLSLCQWRCNKCHIPVSQIQQMSCHKSAHYGIILINGIYSSSFLFVTDNNKGNCLCHFLYLQLKIRIWIAAVDNSLRLQCLHHPQIFFLQPGVSLGITDKNSIPLFIRHCLNPL